MMSLFLIAALGLARDQTFLKLGEVTSLKESASAAALPGSGSEAPAVKNASDSVLQSVAEEEKKHLAALQSKENADQEAKRQIEDLKAKTKKDLEYLQNAMDKNNKYFWTKKHVKIMDKKFKLFKIPTLKKDDDTEEHKKRIQNITAELQKTTDSMGTEELTSTHKSIVDALKDRIETLTKEAQIRDEDVSTLTEHIRHTEERLNTAISEQRCAEAGKEQIEADKKKIDQINTELENDISALRNKVGDQTARLLGNTATQEEIAGLYSQLQRLQDSHTSIVANLNAEVKELTDQLSAQSEEEKNEDRLRRNEFQFQEDLGEVEELDPKDLVSSTHHKDTTIRELREVNDRLGKELQAAQEAKAAEGDKLQKMLGDQEEERKKTDAEHIRNVAWLNEEYKESARLNEEYKESFNQFKKDANEYEETVRSLQKQLRAKQSTDGVKDGDLVKELQGRISSLEEQAVEHGQEKIAHADRIRELAQSKEEAIECRRHVEEQLGKNAGLSTENSTLKNYVSSIASAQYQGVSFGAKGEILTESLEEVLAEVRLRAGILKDAAVTFQYMEEELDQFRSQDRRAGSPTDSDYYSDHH